MADTNISWADTVWNPVTGCTRVSPGCDHCYAFALHDKRYAANRKRSLAEQQPAGGVARARAAGLDLPYPVQYDTPFSTVRLMPERLDQPLHWKKPRRIFVNSMSDLFHDDVPDGFIAWVWLTMARAPQHTFQILTKRPERMRDFVQRWSDLEGEDFSAFRNARGPEATREAHPSGRGQLFAEYLDELGKLTGGAPPPGSAWPTFDWVDGPMRWPRTSFWRHVWLGVSVEDQERADERIPLLLDTPAAVHFLSAEPLLGPIRLPCRVHDGPGLFCNRAQCREPSGLDWLICGGESGKGWRPMDHAWARSLREQCRAAGVAFFFKQAAAYRNETPSGDPTLDGCREFPVAIK